MARIKGSLGSAALSSEMVHCRCVSLTWPPSGQLLYMPTIVTSGVFKVQQTFGCVIVRRGASRLSGLCTADCEQKLRTKACRLDSLVAGLTSPSWFPGMAMIGAL